MIQRIDNVLDDNSCDILYKIAKDQIRYYYNTNTSYYSKLETNDPLEYDIGQFTSPLIIDGEPDHINSKYIELVSPIVSKIQTIVDFTRVDRLKLNLLLKHNIMPDQYNTPHKDPGKYSFVYYINDSDGDTFFFTDDKKIISRVTPKQNSGVLFDSNILHASSNPAVTSARFVLNFVFK
jgi:hypothetical protein